ncbi:MAG: ATP-dependent zinc metalloprotease FtsH [Candidatus Peregrinibacteria bacterium]|nr:ATP-dependent zinc metalloprotease FtsH [Candidatus Peregrinibacteria bacterium]MDZ4244762.1 ATP-dependent zinc metalloprotease FtsH [Candidatus Gracilibacteria bacterium]
MQKQSNHRQKSFTILLVIALLLSAFYIMGYDGQIPEQKVLVSDFVHHASEGMVNEVKVNDNKIIYSIKGDATRLIAVKEKGESLNNILESIPQEKRDFKVEIVDTESSNFWTDLLIGIIPFALIIGFFIFMMRQAQGSNNQAMSFGKSNARLHANDGEKKTTFNDVAGGDEAKMELTEIVDFLKSPDKYIKIGAKIPKGVMLIGAPGTGKTLLARAVAGEANVPFFSISGSEFVEMFVGVGASRVRDLFKKARRNAPCIIFIDEIDAVGRKRGAGLGGGNDEREQTLNQILTEMDGFEQGTNVIIIAATNRPDVLDPALLRPGRFDRRVTVDLPTLDDREAILKVHSRNKPLTSNVALRTIAKKTPGFSGADLENIMNEAAILTARYNKKVISPKEIDMAIEKVVLGNIRSSSILSEKEKEIIAYHETGHAIMNHVLKNCDDVHKITIVSRGMALGVTWTLPDKDHVLTSKAKFEDEIAALLGGRVAEEMIFGKEEITTGASNDISRATKMAKRMVTEYGMSPLGSISYGDNNQEVFLGRDFGHMKDYSEEIAKKIDAETAKIVEDGYKRAHTELKKNSKKLHNIAKLLVKKETLNQNEFVKAFDGA